MARVHKYTSINGGGGCYTLCTLVQQAGMLLTGLEPNIEYILGLTIQNGIITNSSQRMIQIHCHVSNLTPLRSDVRSEYVLPIFNLQYERTVKHYQFCLEEDTMQIRKTQRYLLTEESIYHYLSKLSGNPNQSIKRMYQQLGKLHGNLLTNLRIINKIQSSLI